MEMDPGFLDNSGKQQLSFVFPQCLGFGFFLPSFKRKPLLCCDIGEQLLCPTSKAEHLFPLTKQHDLPSWKSFTVYDDHANKVG